MTKRHLYLAPRVVTVSFRVEEGFQASLGMSHEPFFGPPAGHEAFWLPDVSGHEGFDRPEGSGNENFFGEI